MKTFALTAAVLLCSLPVFGQLSTFKDWDQSPEGYFLTADERVQWRTVTSDDAALKFVTEFRERRGGEAFTKELKKRVDNADKYLSIGSVKGSSTLRGKAVILFGAPVNIAVNDRVVKGGYTPAGSTAAVTDLGTGATARSGDGDTQKMGTGQPGKSFRDFTFTFSAKENPAFNGKDYVVVIEADTATGKDRAGKGVKQKDLDALFEAAASASIRTN